MNFQPHLAAKSLDGTKTVTRRRVSTNPRSPWHRNNVFALVGKEVAVCPGRGEPAIGRIRVTDVTLVRLGDTTEAEARLEGCDSLEHFDTTWIQIHRGNYDADENVWRIAFEAATSTDEGRSR